VLGRGNFIWVWKGYRRTETSGFVPIVMAVVWSSGEESVVGLRIVVV